jgi:hypothetical protein
LNINRGFGDLLQILRLTLFEKEMLSESFEQRSHDVRAQEATQLSFCEF